MSTSVSALYTCAHAATSTPCTAFLNPVHSELRNLRTQPYFWSPYTTDAMVFRDEKFKAYNHRASRDPAPQFETLHEDHFATSSRQPNYPLIQTPEFRQPQPQHQSQTLEGEFLKWFMVFALLMLTLWVLGFAWPMFGSTVTLVVIGMVSVISVVSVLQWLETREGDVVM